MSQVRNVLLLVIDQIRADCSGTVEVPSLLAGIGQMPNLDALRSEAASFERHYSVTTPCGPARASLLTGLYAMTHRMVRNATPLAHGIDNIATEARKSGYEPLLFGYTDTGPDPRVHSPADPELRSYERVMTGFREIVEARLEENHAWRGYLHSRVDDLPPFEKFFAPREFDPDRGPRPDDPAFYDAHDSDTAFLTDRFLDEIAFREGWLAHLTYLRPHPPLIAPRPYNRMYRAEEMPRPTRLESKAATASVHPFLAAAMNHDWINAMVEGYDAQLDDDDPDDVACLRAVYLGLASEVDHHVGRVIAWLKDSGRYDNTLIVITGDHGEMLGDHYMWAKYSFHDASFHVPLIIRDPDRPESHGTRFFDFTESVDVAPTILDWIGREPPRGMDGRSLLPFLSGDGPGAERWRDHVYCEFDYGEPDEPTLWQRELGLSLREANFAILREERYKLVHFNGGLPPLLFDLQSPGGESVDLAGDPAYAETLLRMTRKLLDHRMRFQDHRLSDTKLTATGVVNAPT